jgi:hypothetical protein
MSPVVILIRLSVYHHDQCIQYHGAQWRQKNLNNFKRILKTFHRQRVFFRIMSFLIMVTKKSLVETLLEFNFVYYECKLNIF